MASPTIPTLPTAPQRSAGSADLSANADAFVAALEPWGAALDDFGDWADALAIPTPATVNVGVAAITTAATTTPGAIGSWSQTVAVSGGTFTSAGLFTPTVGGLFMFGMSALADTSASVDGTMMVGLYNTTSGIYFGYKSARLRFSLSPLRARAALSFVILSKLTTGQAVEPRFIYRSDGAFSVAAGTTFWARRIV